VCCLFDWPSGRGGRKGEFLGQFTFDLFLSILCRLTCYFNNLRSLPTLLRCSNRIQFGRSLVLSGQLEMWLRAMMNKQRPFWTMAFSKIWFVFSLIIFELNNFQSVLVNSGVHQISRECLWVSPFKYFIYKFVLSSTRYCQILRPELRSTLPVYFQLMDWPKV